MVTRLKCWIYSKRLLFESVRITRNADPNKYSYSEYSIVFDSHSFVLFPNGWGRNVIISGADMRSSVHANNKYKDILILAKAGTKRLDNSTLTAEAEYCINFLRSQRKSLHYNGSNGFLIVNATKIHQCKAKDSKIKRYPCV